MYPAIPPLSQWQRYLFESKVAVGDPDECWAWMGAAGREQRGIDAIRCIHIRRTWKHI